MADVDFRAVKSLSSFDLLYYQRLGLVWPKSAARSWNELPKDIEEAQSIRTFSRKLKTHLS